MTMIVEKGKTTVAVDEVHDNTYQELIYINADRLNLILIDHLKNLRDESAWQIPLSFVLAIVLVFVTTDFKPTLGVSSDFLSGMFFLVGLLCAGWFVKCLFKFRKSKTIEDVIAAVKCKPQQSQAANSGINKTTA